MVAAACAAAAARAFWRRHAAGTPRPPIYAPEVPGLALDFPPTSAVTRTFAPNGGTSPAGCTTARGQSLGFQITFFRTKPAVDENNPSAFAPRQLLIAHCAISDPTHAGLWQDQRIRRAGMGLAGADVGRYQRVDRSVGAAPPGRRRRRGRQLPRDRRCRRVLAAIAPRRHAAAAAQRRFGLQPQGPRRGSASYYYSVPHLKVAGSVRRGGGSAEQVSGEAWLDHEWSSEYLDAEAVGWDWAGINLDDGGALMVFRIRDARGATRFAGGTLRDAAGRTQIFQPSDIALTPTRRWTSPHTGVVYPVAWRLRAGPSSIRARAAHG